MRTKEEQMLYARLKNADKEELNDKLFFACANGNLNLIKYLLTSPELKEHADIHYGGGKPFIAASYNGHLDVVKYLLFSPELKEHADLHTEDDLAFRSACDSQNLEAVQYYIFELNIEKSKPIEVFFRERKNLPFIEKVKDMFHMRELSEQLNKNPGEENKEKKKVKI